MSGRFETYDIKRTLEMWSSGLYVKEFRLAAAGESVEPPPGLLPSVARLLVESRSLEAEPIMAGYFDEQKKHLEWRDMIRRDSASNDPRLRAWRERQINRCFLEIGESQNSVITHIPAAFELTRGCSVNCWFCAMEPGPLRGVFRYTPENAKLWREVLTALAEVVGEGAKWSSSYWGTEPLDNPDYEVFCHDFFSIYGIYPQTTTAVPLRDVERTRALLADSHAKGCRINRFSIHDAERFKGVLANFSALSLANTELLLENPERAGAPLVTAGKLFNMMETMPETAAREKERAFAMVKAENPDIAARYDTFEVNTFHLDEDSGADRLRLNVPATTSCMSGFLVNMVERTVELVSPCAADHEWPRGYIVFDRGNFDSGDSFRSLLRRMVEDNMPEKVLPADRVALTRRANYRRTEKGFVLSSVFGRVGYENEKMGPYLARLGDLLRQGRQEKIRLGEIALECFYLFGKHEGLTFGLINDLFNKGLLETGKSLEART